MTQYADFSQICHPCRRLEDQQHILKKVHTYGFHFCQNPETLIFRTFLCFFSLLTFPTFFKNQDPSLVLFYDSLTLCKKSEKTDELIQRSCVANNRSSHRRCFVKKKSVLRNFAKFKGKQVCQRLFNKVAGLRPATLLKESLAQVFFCEFCEITKSTFFTKYLRETASGKNGQTDRKTHEQRQVHMTLPLVQVFKNYRHVKYSVTLLKNFLRGLFIVIS